MLRAMEPRGRDSELAIYSCLSPILSYSNLVQAPTPSMNRASKAYALPASVPSCSTPTTVPKPQSSNLSPPLQKVNSSWSATLSCVHPRPPHHIQSHPIPYVINHPPPPYSHSSHRTGSSSVHGTEVIERVGGKDGAAGCSDDRFVGVGGGQRGSHVDRADSGGDKACVVDCVVELGPVLHS